MGESQEQYKVPGLHSRQNRRVPNKNCNISGPCTLLYIEYVKEQQQQRNRDLFCFLLHGMETFIYENIVRRFFNGFKYPTRADYTEHLRSDHSQPNSCCLVLTRQHILFTPSCLTQWLGPPHNYLKSQAIEPD